MTILLDDSQITLVRNYGLLGGFSDAECHALLKDGELRRYEEGQMVFPRGGFADEMGWVLAGQASAQLPGRSRRELEVLHCGPGTCVGFIGFIGRKSHFLEYRAMMRTDILLFDRAMTEGALERQDALFSRLLMALAYGAFERVSIIENTCRSNALL